MKTVQANRTQTERKAMLKVKGYWRCKFSTEGKDCEHSFDSTLSPAKSNLCTLQATEYLQHRPGSSHGLAKSL